MCHHHRFRLQEKLLLALPCSPTRRQAAGTHLPGGNRQWHLICNGEPSRQTERWLDKPLRSRHRLCLCESVSCSPTAGDGAGEGRNFSVAAEIGISGGVGVVGCIETAPNAKSPRCSYTVNNIFNLSTVDIHALDATKRVCPIYLVTYSVNGNTGRSYPIV